MKARLVASVALALGIVIGGSGCSMVTYQATTEHYDASDGISADIGTLDLRNILVVSDDGNAGNLLMTVVNTGSEDVDLEIEYADGTSVDAITVRGGSTVAFGVDEAEHLEAIDPVLLTEIGTMPGSLLPMFFSYAGAEGEQLQVPVLDGSLPEYAAFVPTTKQLEAYAAKQAAAKIAAQVKSAAPTETPAPTETAAPAE